MKTYFRSDKPITQHPLKRRYDRRVEFGSLWLLLLTFLSASTLWAQPNALPVDEKRVVRETMLTDIQLHDFKELTEQKMAEFQRYLSIIADPRQQNNIRELAIENALLLFMPDATMQVGATGLNAPVNTYPLPIYLRRLKNLDRKYVDINISFYDIALVGDWSPTTQGYGTTATYFQRFKAFDQKGHIVYGAKTAKQLTVDLRDRNDPFYDEHRWTVLLGDVRLSETRRTQSVHK
ncbi:hypothetical protein [Spirosoma gilvum]